MLSPLSGVPTPIGSYYRAPGYLLNAMFGTNQAAPMPASLAQDTGLIKKHLDTNNRVSINSGDLVFSGAVNAIYSDPGYYFTDANSAGFARVGGMVCIMKVVADTSPQVLRTGLSNSTTLANTSQAGALFSTVPNLTYIRHTDIANAQVGVWSVSTTYLLAFLLHSNRLYFYANGGAYSDWTLLNVDESNTAATIWPTLSGAGAMSWRIPFVRLSTDTAELRNDTFYSLSQASPVSGTIYTATADGIYHLSCTLGAGASGKRAELRYRVQDANNYMLARVQWNTGTSQYDFVTGHVIAGVETLQGSPIANVGAVTRIRVHTLGNAHNYYTETSTTWVKRYAEITDSNFASNTGAAGIVASGVTQSQLTAWRRTSTMYSTPFDKLAVA